jgi:hypothetical protein
MKSSSQSRKQHTDEQQGAASKPVSLAPLDFEAALDGLLATDPKKIKEAERKAEKKRAAKKK